MKKTLNCVLLLFLSALLLILSSCSEEKDDTPKYVENIYKTSSGELTVSFFSDIKDKDGEPIDVKKINEYSKLCADKYEEAWSYLTENNPYVAELNSDTDHILSTDTELLSLINGFLTLSDTLSGKLTLFTSPESFVFDGDNIEKTKSDAKITFSAVDNGYSVEAASEFLRDEKKLTGFYITDGTVAGVYSSGDDIESFNIGVTYPGKDEIYGNFTVTDGYVAQTENSEPDNKISKAVVYSDSGTVAEALSNVLCENGEELMSALYGGELKFEAILFFSDGKTVCTAGLDDSNNMIFVPLEK